MSIAPNRGTQSQYWDWLVVEHCCDCGIPFAMPQSFKNKCLEHRCAKSFYCPNGHAQHYTGETDAERFRRERDEAKAQAESWKEEYQRGERRRRATKGALTKTRKRISAGVCPCCNRSFENLAQHMKGKHPAYVNRARGPSHDRAR